MTNTKHAQHKLLLLNKETIDDLNKSAKKIILGGNAKTIVIDADDTAAETAGTSLPALTQGGTICNLPTVKCL